MIKIAYELAFLWLGDAYLDDPKAAELRAAICKPDPLSTAGLPGYYGDAMGCKAFKHWIPHEEHHLAYSAVVNNCIAVAVRIFDLYAAVVPITNDATQYLKHPDDSAILRFIAIDSVSGRIHDTSCMDEIKRIAALMAKEERFPPFPDPL